MIKLATLAELNESAKSHTDFFLQSFDGHRLVVVGSFDLSYYHYIELHFMEVDHINCPVCFFSPIFTDEGPIPNGELRRFVIRSDEGQHEIIARSVEVFLGMVYYHGRDQQSSGEP
jgi:hypothetical protein